MSTVGTSNGNADCRIARQASRVDRSRGGDAADFGLGVRRGADHVRTVGDRDARAKSRRKWMSASSSGSTPQSTRRCDRPRFQARSSAFGARPRLRARSVSPTRPAHHPKRCSTAADWDAIADRFTVWTRSTGRRPPLKRFHQESASRTAPTPPNTTPDRRSNHQTMPNSRHNALRLTPLALPGVLRFIARRGLTDSMP